jgi:ferredoxin
MHKFSDEVALMAIKRVWIEDGCISCGACVDACPEVFDMPDTAVVKQGADFNAHEKEIKEAADGCPVEVIKYE